MSELVKMVLPRRLPFESFERVVMSRVAVLDVDRQAGCGLRRLLGEHDARYFHRARHWGYVSDVVADRICVTRLRVHPAEVWGPDWFEPLATPDRTWGPKPKPRPALEEQRVGITIAAQICGVPIQRVRRWVDEGKLQYVMRSRQRLYRRGDLEALTADQEEKFTPPARRSGKLSAPQRSKKRALYENSDLVGSREAARICEVSFTTFYDWIIAGKVPYTMPKGVRLFRRDDLLALRANAA